MRYQVYYSNSRYEIELANIQVVGDLQMLLLQYFSLPKERVFSIVDYADGKVLGVDYPFSQHLLVHDLYDLDLMINVDYFGGGSGTKVLFTEWLLSVLHPDPVQRNLDLMRMMTLRGEISSNILDFDGRRIFEASRHSYLVSTVNLNEPPLDEEPSDFRIGHPEVLHADPNERARSILNQSGLSNTRIGSTNHIGTTNRAESSNRVGTTNRVGSTNQVGRPRSNNQVSNRINLNQSNQDDDDENAIIGTITTTLSPIDGDPSQVMQTNQIHLSGTGNVTQDELTQIMEQMSQSLFPSTTQTNRGGRGGNVSLSSGVGLGGLSGGRGGLSSGRDGLSSGRGGLSNGRGGLLGGRGGLSSGRSGLLGGRGVSSSLSNTITQNVAQGGTWQSIFSGGAGNFFNLLSQLQDVPVTLSRDDLNRLPIFKFSEIPVIMRNQPQCSICLENFQDSDDVRMLLCRHYFHSSCVDRWLVQENVRCPVCRQDNRVSSSNRLAGVD